MITGYEIPVNVHLFTFLGFDPSLRVQNQIFDFAKNEPLPLIDIFECFCLHQIEDIFNIKLTNLFKMTILYKY